MRRTRSPLGSPHWRAQSEGIGLSHPRVDVAAEVLRRFGMGHADVLNTRLPGGPYLDEIGPAGELRCCRVRDGVVGPVEMGAVELSMMTGLLSVDLPAPRGPAEAVDRTADLLAGGGLESHRALVALNGAYLLVRSGLARSLAQGKELAEDALRSGTALTRISTSRVTGRRA